MTEESKSHSDALAEYRQWVVAAEQKSQEDFDKTVLSLSGGALGISFVFLKDVIGPHPIALSGVLLGAWFSWAFSTFSVLASYYLSHLALRRTISQIDDGTIYEQLPGGAFAKSTATLNAIGAILFLAGVCCITVFAGANLSSKGAPSDRKETALTTSPTNTATTTTPTTNVTTTVTIAAPPGTPPKPKGRPPTTCDERLHSTAPADSTQR